MTAWIVLAIGTAILIGGVAGLIYAGTRHMPGDIDRTVNTMVDPPGFTPSAPRTGERVTYPEEG